ncbi:nudix hydrolase 15, mitochondrial-like isoform X2 [Mangifera indica]|uniref:nudix hydrolase 15, mitochondrial-like isoform X2 n=1 Tax=Mangifera indica TaxID=29780 RepID=UPI001CFB5C5B|nr:nudix hydrolase 15, mitochondrial-like isoform X2 [Mangifera indica]
MDSNKTGDRYLRLETLAQELRVYKEKQYEIPRSEGEPTSQDSNLSLTKRAAVLVCIFEGDDGDLRVILTKRSSTLSLNSGDVALPGGKRDETDADDVATALREAKEEIGLDPSLVNVVTVLQPFVTKIGMAVVPVIGILSERKAFIPALSADEVEAIFDAPLEIFLKDENRRQVEREWMGDKYLLHFFDHEAEGKQYIIWALTAGILIKVASIVFQRPPAFSERRPKFWNRILCLKGVEL